MKKQPITMMSQEEQEARESLPDGYVFLGKGHEGCGMREFIVPKQGHFDGILFRIDSTIPKWSRNVEGWSGMDRSALYAAPVGSEIAALNGYTSTLEDVEAKTELLPEDDSERQQIRPFDYMMNYFPQAQLAKAKHSYEANIKHNGEEGMVWASDKSIGDGNQIIRHLMQAFDCHKNGDAKGAEYHLKCVAWRGDELFERYARKMEPFNKL